MFGDATGGDQNVAALDDPRARRGADAQANLLAGAAFDLERLGAQNDIDALIIEKLQQRLGYVAILARDKLRRLFDDGDAAAEPAHRLRQLESDIAAAKHDQMIGKRPSSNSLDMGERPAAASPGTSGIAARVPTLRKTRSPASSPVRPSG